MYQYKDETIVVIDFETTGFTPKTGCRITEVCLVKLLNEKEIDRYTSLINCGVEIPKHITELTGITQEMVDMAPLVKDVIPKIVDFIGDNILCGQHVEFDELFLKAETELLGLKTQYKTTICTKKLAQSKHRGLKSYSLQPLADFLKLERNGDAHRAESDVDLTIKLLYKLLEN